MTDVTVSNQPQFSVTDRVVVMGGPTIPEEWVGETGTVTEIRARGDDPSFLNVMVLMDSDGQELPFQHEDLKSVERK